MKNIIITITALVLGILVGVITSRFLFTGTIGLIPMALAAFVVGWMSVNQKNSFINGAMYGWFMVFSFMIAGYTGAAPVLTKLIPFAILGLAGGVCGLIGSFVGYFLKKKLKK